MNLSEGRVNSLANAVLKMVKREKLVEIRNEHLFLAEVKKAFVDEFSVDEKLDAAARARIPHRVLPGSREWDVQYRRFYEEERQKLDR